MKIGSVGYATEQGIGHLMKWFYDAGIITDVLLLEHPRHAHHPEWYPDNTPVVRAGRIKGQEVEDWLSRISAAIFFETPFDWNLPTLCKAHGVKTVLVSMHEWTPERPRSWFDLVISPSLLDKDYFPDSIHLTIPVPPGVTWKCRNRAKRFLHNAGHIGHREHKGTRQLLESLAHSQGDFKLTIRCQYKGYLEEMAKRAGVFRDHRLTLEEGYLPYETLFDGYDVYVAPEKLNGLSLPLQEAFASGLLVMTTDRYPHNTWLPKTPLIPVHQYEKARVSSGCYEVDEAIVNPKDIAAKMDEWTGVAISDYSFFGRQWAQENSWDVLGPQWRRAIECL